MNRLYGQTVKFCKSLYINTYRKVVVSFNSTGRKLLSKIKSDKQKLKIVCL